MLIDKTPWFERKFQFGLEKGMLPFYFERMEGTVIRLEKKVNGVPDNILSNKLDSKWSVKQNIGHLAEVEEISLKRLDEIEQGISPMSPAVFEPRGDYNAMSVVEVIRLFSDNRKKTFTRYASLSNSDLEKSSLHPRLKVMMTPVDLALFHAEHDDHHLVRINEILQTLLR